MPEVAREDEVELAVQVNGKVRTRITVPLDLSGEDVKARAVKRPSRAHRGEVDREGGAGAGTSRERGGEVKRRAALVLLRHLGGCGYALVGKGVTTDASIKRIGVPLFKDTTGKAGLDQKVTQKVVEELLRRGRFDVVPDTPGRRRAGRGRARVVQRHSGRASRARTRPHQAGPLLDHASRARVRYIEGRRDRAHLVERLVLASATSTRSGPTPTRSSTARSSRSSASPPPFARNLVAAMLEAF